MPMRFSVLLLLGSAVWAQEWTVLFDGKSLAGWKAAFLPEVAAGSWEITGGTLRPLPVMRKAALFSSSTYRNFVLEFEFKVAPLANGGIKYLIQERFAARHRGNRFLPVETTPEQEGDGYIEGANGLEFQIVDDAGEEAKDPKRRSGALYGLVAPTNPPDVRPGVFYQGRIVVNGDKIEHYLNGVRVVDLTLGSPQMDAAWDATKDRRQLALRPLPLRDTPIVITHHDTSVQYRNIRVRRLP
jgi:hypothetical protein